MCSGEGALDPGHLLMLALLSVHKHPFDICCTGESLTGNPAYEDCQHPDVLWRSNSDPRASPYPHPVALKNWMGLCNTESI